MARPDFQPENWASLARLPTRDSGPRAASAIREPLPVERVRHSRLRPIMLRINPLQPPRPFVASPAKATAGSTFQSSFIMAEDYDSTGIMAGVDPSESRYWWLPELYGPEPAPTAPQVAAPISPAAQATSRAGERTAAAA